MWSAPSLPSVLGSQRSTILEISAPSPQREVLPVENPPNQPDAPSRYSWLDEIGHGATLLEHIQQVQCPTWRTFPAKRSTALSKTLEPFLLDAVAGKVEAWEALAIIMRILLRAPTRNAADVAPGEGDQGKDAEINRRLQLARRGEWRQLALEYCSHIEDQDRKSRIRSSKAEEGVQSKPSSVKQRAADRCCRLAQSGEWSRAASAIASPPLMSHREGLEDALRSKIYAPSEEEERTWAETVHEYKSKLRRCTDGPVIEFFDLAARSSARGSAQGLSGWRLEHVRTLRQAGGQPWMLFCETGRMMVTRRAPDFWYNLMGSPKLVPFFKSHSPEGEDTIDPRPVGCVDPLWRWASRALMLSLKDDLRDYLAPEQYAVGMRAGIEAMAHAIDADLLDRNIDALLSGDARNAFNSVSRTSMLRAAADASPALALAMISLYESSTTYLYYAKSGEAPSKIVTITGAVQGDPLAMALYSLAQRAPIRWTSAAIQAAANNEDLNTVWAEPQPPVETQNALRAWVISMNDYRPENDTHQSVIKARYYADDGVWQIPRWLLAHARLPIQLSMDVIGIQMKDGFWNAWGPHGVPQVDGVNRALAHEGLVVAGAPITDRIAMPGTAVIVGGAAYVSKYLDVVIQRTQGMCEACVELPRYAAAAYPAHKIAMQILVKCAKPRFAFFTRLLTPSLATDAASKFDQVVSEAAASLLGWTSSEHGLTRAQSELRADDGGLGLIPEERRAPFAYLGSWLDSAQALAAERDVMSIRGPLGDMLRTNYDCCVRLNPANLPPNLLDFLSGIDPSELDKKYLRADGGVRWQALLSRGMAAEAVKSWKRGASREARDRLEEMGGKWINGPDVRGCTLTNRFYLVAMRLRFGLSVRPAVQGGGAKTCKAVSSRGKRCDKILDEHGHHASTCSLESRLVMRHSGVVTALARELQKYGVSVAKERWIEELSEAIPETDTDGMPILDEHGRQCTRYKEARLDIVVRDGERVWWVDFTCFHPFVGTGPRATQRKYGQWSCASRERGKHSRYVSRRNGRRVQANGTLVPIAANTYAAIGEEGRAFFDVMRTIAKRKKRTCSGSTLETFVQSLVVFFSSSNIIASYGGTSDVSDHVQHASCA